MHDIIHISAIFGDISNYTGNILYIINAANNIPNGLIRHVYVMGKENWKVLEKERDKHPEHKWIYVCDENNIPPDELKRLDLEKAKFKYHDGSIVGFSHLLNKIYITHLARQNGYKKTILLDWDCFSLLPIDQKYYDLINSKSPIFQAPMSWYRNSIFFNKMNGGVPYASRWRTQHQSCVPNSGWLYIGEDLIVDNALNAIRENLVQLTLNDEPYWYHGFEKFIGREVPLLEYGDIYEPLVVSIDHNMQVEKYIADQKVNYFMHYYKTNLARNVFAKKFYKEYT